MELSLPGCRCGASGGSTVAVAWDMLNGELTVPTNCNSD